MRPRARVTTSRLIFSLWDLYPSVLVGSLVLLAAYGMGVRWRFTRRAWLFLLGVATMAWALVSFLDVLGDGYLFSAHMAQHLILIEVVPILLLLGIPPELMARVLEVPLIDRAEHWLGNPWVAWWSGVLVLFVWHLPPLYNAALASQTVHIFQHLSFLVTSTIFWWPVLSPVEDRRVSPPAAFLYLMAAATANTLLGIVVAYVPPGTYPAYDHPADPVGILALVRDQWHLTREADQELGGILMWFPGGFVIAAVILHVLAKWYAEADLAAEIVGQDAAGAGRT